MTGADTDTDPIEGVTGTPRVPDAGTVTLVGGRAFEDEGEGGGEVVGDITRSDGESAATVRLEDWGPMAPFGS